NKDGKFKVLFDWQRKYQLNFYFEVPGFTTLVSDHYNDMDDELKALIFPRLKDCDNCGYCMKTGKHKLLALELALNEKISMKCPFYPYLSWGKLEEESISIIKKLIDFSIKYL
ncbi:MAG: hypothetical protein LBH43_00340, partial [Treponema sp.]|nr:hypothetical protein [Treponema sp.]